VYLFHQIYIKLLIVYWKKYYECYLVIENPLCHKFFITNFIGYELLVMTYYMKILIINNLYPPYARGGAEQVVKRTVEGLLARGHDVVLITSSPEKEEKIVDEKLTIYRLKSANVFFYTFAHEHDFFSRFLWHIIDIFHIGVARDVKKILLWEQPDVVHTHNLMGLSFLIPYVIRRVAIRHVHTVHDVQLVEPSGIILKLKENTWRYNAWPTKLYTWVMKYLMGSPDVVISPSQFLRDFYTERGFFVSSQKTVLRNPLTIAREQGIKNKKQDDNDLLHILYVGQIETHKGIYLLIDAIKILDDVVRKKISVHIVGSGSQFDVLKLYGGSIDQIIFYGKKERNELPALFAMSDIVVVPSLCYENSPTVIFESLYFGIPVLASRIEGIAELIDEGKNGFTFEAGHSHSLADKITWLIAHRDMLDTMDVSLPSDIKEEGEYVDCLLKLYT